MFGRRADAKQVRDLSTTRRFMPLLSPRRNESLVYFDTEIEVENALKFIEDHNRTRAPDRQMTLFHLYLRSLALAIEARPGVNRFVAGGRLWEREEVWITFSAKQAIVDGAPILTVKRRFDLDQGLDEMVDGVLDRLTRRRGGEKTQSDREVDLTTKLPPFMIRTALWTVRMADYFGLLPKAMIDDDPMMASVFVANLGSVDMDSGYHHLWQYGSCSMFGTMGKVKQRWDGKQIMSLKYSYDERIADGLYSGITLRMIKEGVENPEKLL